MTRLAQTLGLTEFQTEIIATVRQFVEKESHSQRGRARTRATPTRSTSSTRCATWACLG